VDLASILDHFGQLLLAGELEVGDRREIAFDEGMGRALITIADPVDPDCVEAFGARPGSRVVPLRWELWRGPIGDNLPVSEEVAADIERVFLEWHDVVLELGGRIPWQRPDTDPDQVFGPWSTVVELVRTAVAMLGSRGRLTWCIDYLEGRRSEVGRAIGVAAALARRHGRSVAFEAAESAGRRDADTWIDPGDGLFRNLGQQSAQDALPLVRHIVGFILGSLYGLLVVGDLLDEQRQTLMLDPFHALCADVVSDA
jgi:hypothetical protein